MSIIGFIMCMTLVIVGVFLIVLACVHYDRIIVAFIRRLRIPVYPEAVGIALLIYQRPQEWILRTEEMAHEKIGCITTDRGVNGIIVYTAFGRWRPNVIERRIIREAVDWRIKSYVRSRIGQALNAGLFIEQ